MSSHGTQSPWTKERAATRLEQRLYGRTTGKDLFLDTVWQHGKASASSYIEPSCSYSPLSRTNPSAVFFLFFFLFDNNTLFMCHSYAHHSIYHGYVARPGGAPLLDYSILASVFLEPISHL